MNATPSQLRLAGALIDDNNEHTGTYLAYQQRVLLTAKQHRTMTDGWGPGELPWGNALETTKGVMNWRLFPGPVGYFLEYGSTMKETTVPAVIGKAQPVRQSKPKRVNPSIIPVSVQVARTPNASEVEIVAKNNAFVEKERAKTTMLITGEIWQTYQGKKWVKLEHPVRVQAYCISADHSARVLVEWKKLKVENIQMEVFTQPELIAA